VGKLISYKISEFAKKIGVSQDTLRNWDKDGILIANRTPTGRRFYTETQYQQYIKNLVIENEEDPKEITINLRIIEKSDNFIVEIQHLITKEYIQIKDLKTYKSTMAMVKKKKDEYEQIGITVKVEKNKDK
jgi:hypothetical protein